VHGAEPKKNVRLAVVSKMLSSFWCVLCLATLATAQQPQGGGAEHSAQPYRGRIAGRIYSNDSLGLTYQLPEGFFVNSDLPDRMQTGSLLLMIADQHTGRPLRDRVIMVADDAARYTWTTKEYVTKYVRAKPQRLNVTVLREAYPIQVAGQEFYRVDYKKTEEGKTGYETFVCVRRKGFFVSWTFVSFSQEEEVDQMAGSIQTVSFR